VLLCVGDRAGLFGMGTSGEGTDTATLRLPGVQHQLVEAVLAANPRTVLIAITGRPYAIADFATSPVATIQAFMPGQAGAGSIAGVLSGRVNPSGRLPVQIPRLDGPQPSTYLQAALGLYTEGVSNLDPTPAFPFGHGLSYTAFEISDLQLDQTEIGTEDTLTATVTVRNTGTRAGVEVVQVYLTDWIAQTVRPTKRLIAFARVNVETESTVEVRFGLHADLTSFIGLDQTRIVEPGLFKLVAASSAAHRATPASFTIVGTVKPVSDRWTMTATVSTSVLN
jgi:beta-xylosidase